MPRRNLGLLYSYVIYDHYAFVGQKVVQCHFVQLFLERLELRDVAFKSTLNNQSRDIYKRSRLPMFTIQCVKAIQPVLDIMTYWCWATIYIVFIYGIYMLIIVIVKI